MKISSIISHFFAEKKTIVPDLKKEPLQAILHSESFYYTHSTRKDYLCRKYRILFISSVPAESE